MRRFRHVSTGVVVAVAAETASHLDRGSWTPIHGQLVRPGRGDSKAAWVAYAETQGAVDAETMTKNGLIERYG